MPIYDTKNKESANAGKKVHLFELTYTQPTSAGSTKGTFKAPHRVIAWVHHFPTRTSSRNSRSSTRSPRNGRSRSRPASESFRPAPRTNKPADPKNTAAAATLEELWKLTPEERKIRRTAAANAAYDRSKAGVAKDWSAGPEGRFFVLNHADSKFSLKVTALGGAILDFLDKNFDSIGKAEFVRKPILKLCADSREHQGMRSEGAWWAGTNLEIITYKDEDEGSRARPSVPSPNPFTNIGSMSAMSTSRWPPPIGSSTDSSRRSARRESKTAASSSPSTSTNT